MITVKSDEKQLVACLKDSNFWLSWKRNVQAPMALIQNCFLLWFKISFRIFIWKMKKLNNGIKKVQIFYSNLFILVTLFSELILGDILLKKAAFM